jgi:(R)-2-hydroxyacyl-CoA dehydratese activating ATPase
MTWIAGLDIGSALSKAVILKDGKLTSHSIRETEGNFASVAKAVLDEALAQADLAIDRLDLIGASGLGADFVPYPFQKTTDISCHSRGAHYFLPTVRTLLEIGNQVSRVTKVTPGGKVAGSSTGDKCAAGSGRILQIVAKVLQIDLNDMGAYSLRAAQPAKFTTGCAVFLETETISRVAEGTPKEDIIAGLHQALAARIAVMAQRMTIEEECAITGGGALDAGLVRTMEKQIGSRIHIPEHPLLSGAIGAALIARERSDG